VWTWVRGPEDIGRALSDMDAPVTSSEKHTALASRHRW
jgi:hypothetical protein